MGIFEFEKLVAVLARVTRAIYIYDGVRAQGTIEMNHETMKSWSVGRSVNARFE